MSWFSEQTAKAEGTATGEAKKSEKVISSWNTLRDAYFDAKNAGGKSLYDFVQKHKSNLQELFKDSPEMQYISLIPSLDQEIELQKDDAARQSLNKTYKEDPILKTAKVSAKSQSIKSERERYRPDIAKLRKDEELFDAAVRADLKRQGFLNPTQDEVDAIKKQYQEESERVEKADVYESKPGWQKAGYSFLFPRAAESRSLGYDPTAKDYALDITELAGTTFGPGAALKTVSKVPKATAGLYKIGKAVSKADDASKGVHGLNFVGDIAGKVGRVGTPEAIVQSGVDVGDVLAYDDEDRERSNRTVGDIARRGLQAGMIAGLLGGARGNVLTPEQAKTLGKADEAIAQNVVLKPRQGFRANKGRISAFDDPRVKEYQKYKTFEKAAATEPADIMAHDALGNNKYFDELAGEASKETIGLRATGFKDQIDDYVKATGKDYISAIDDIIDEMNKGRFTSKFTNDKERAEFYNKLVSERNKLLEDYYKQNFTKGWLLGGGSYAGTQRIGGAFGHAMSDKDRGYEEE